MKSAGVSYYFYIISRGAGLMILFLLVLAYVFCAAGLLVLGLIAFPSALLELTGRLTVTTDLAHLPLMLISAGILLFGAGMCVGAGAVCPASFGVFVRVMRGALVRKEKMLDEKYGTEQTNDDEESGEPR